MSPTCIHFETQVLPVHTFETKMKSTCNIHYTDLPTCPYLTVLVWISVSSTDVFFKIQRLSRKYGNYDVNKCEFVANKRDL